MSTGSKQGSKHTKFPRNNAPKWDSDRKMIGACQGRRHQLFVSSSTSTSMSSSRYSPRQQGHIKSTGEQQGKCRQKQLQFDLAFWLFWLHIKYNTKCILNGISHKSCQPHSPLPMPRPVRYCIYVVGQMPIPSSLAVKPLRLDGNSGCCKIL